MSVHRIVCGTAAAAMLTSGACSTGGGGAAHPDRVLWTDPMCMPAPVDHFEGVSDDRMGSSVAVAETGGGLFLSPPMVQSTKLYVVGGGPGDPGGVVDGLGGSAIISEVDTTSGLFSGTSSSLLRPGGLPIEAGSGARAGATVATVDLLQHYDDTGNRSSFGLVGAGDEILVAAPLGEGGVGKVHWFYPSYNGSLGSFPDVFMSDLYRWDYGGGFSPSGLPSGSGYGTSVAAPASTFGEQASHVVVGAPGANRIYIQAVDATWSGAPAAGAPFSDTTTSLLQIGPADISIGSAPLSSMISAATAGSPPRTPQFGFALLIDDLDLDGLPELVISDPNSDVDSDGDADGYIVVLRGISGFPHYDVSDAKFFAGVPTTSNPGWANEPRAYGAELAAGQVRKPVFRSLFVGDPGSQFRISTGAFYGTICEILFDDWSTVQAEPCRSVEHASPLNGHGLSKLVVGNFAAEDDAGQRDSDVALLEELAVATATEDLLQQLRKGESHVTGTGATVSGPVEFWEAHTPSRYGTVKVYGSEWVEGVQWHKDLAGQERSFHLAQLSPHDLPGGAANGDGFGWDVVAANLQPGSDLLDLVVGTPGHASNRGAVVISQAESRNGFVDPIAGQYSIVDSAGETRRVSVVPASPGYVLSAQLVSVEVRDGGGDPSESLCTLPVFGFDGTAEVGIRTDSLTLSAGGSETQTVPFVFPGGPGDLSVEVVFTHNTSSGDIDVTISEPEVFGVSLWPSGDCRIAPFGNFTLVLEEPNECE